MSRTARPKRAVLNERNILCREPTCLRLYSGLGVVRRRESPSASTPAASAYNGPMSDVTVSPAAAVRGREGQERLRRRMFWLLGLTFLAFFLLFHEQGQPYEDIAMAMNCPVGTIKTWLHRARLEVLERLRRRGMVSEVGHGLR